MEPSEYNLLGKIHSAIETLAQQGHAEISRERFDDHLQSRYRNGHATFPGIQREAFCDLLIEQRILDPAQAAEAGLSLSEWRRQAGRRAITTYSRPSQQEKTVRPNQQIEHISKVMRDAGAVLILAHPGRGGREPSPGEKNRIHLWLDHFADGVEIFPHANSPAYREMHFAIVAERNCPWTGGGDRHNYTATEGHPSEAPAECLELLKKFSLKKQRP